jgi:dihydroxyacetone kinase-like protein
MSDTIAYPRLCRMLLAAAGQIRQNHEMLSRLDAAVGDGDHGTTMLRAMEAVERSVDRKSVV